MVMAQTEAKVQSSYIGTLTGFTGKKERGYAGVSPAGESFYFIWVCHGGSKHVLPWWFSVGFHGDLAEKVEKLPIERCMVRVTGSSWRRQYGDQEQTMFKAETFAYKPKGQEWIEVKGEAGSESLPAVEDSLAGELATSELAIEPAVQVQEEPVVQEQPASPPRPSPLPAFNDRSMTEVGEAEAPPWSKRLARGD
jgi:hypothetical protein